MKPGDLRQFKDSKRARDLGRSHAGRTFMVLREEPSARGDLRGGVDILIDGRVETGLGYFWVADNSEVLSEAG
jgi:hypothetical protein